MLKVKKVYMKINEQRKPVKIKNYRIRKQTKIYKTKKRRQKQSNRKIDSIFK